VVLIKIILVIRHFLPIFGPSEMEPNKGEKEWITEKNS